jgi:hypothetical protein
VIGDPAALRNETTERTLAARVVVVSRIATIELVAPGIKRKIGSRTRPGNVPSIEIASEMTARITWLRQDESWLYAQRAGGRLEMTLEVHRVVEKSDDLHGAGAEPVEQDVPRWPAALGNGKGANARANIVARLATTWFPAIVSMASLRSLRYSRAWRIPQRSFVYARTSMISRLACAERITRIIARATERAQPRRRSPP